MGNLSLKENFKIKAIKFQIYEDMPIYYRYNWGIIF